MTTARKTFRVPILSSAKMILNGGDREQQHQNAKQDGARANLSLFFV
jgi:hypothetical protein